MKMRRKFLALSHLLNKEIERVIKGESVYEKVLFCGINGRTS